MLKYVFIADQNALGHRKLGPPSPLNNKEVIEESRFPGAHKVDMAEASPMERDDWPGPPLTAAAFPELCMLYLFSLSYKIVAVHCAFVIIILY